MKIQKKRRSCSHRNIGSDPDGGNIYWKYTSDRSDIDVTVVLNGTYTLTEGVTHSQGLVEHGC